jgi:hypothetical protein
VSIQELNGMDRSTAWRASSSSLTTARSRHRPNRAARQAR